MKWSLLLLVLALRRGVRFIALVVLAHVLPDNGHLVPFFILRNHFLSLLLSLRGFLLVMRGLNNSQLVHDNPKRRHTIVLLGRLLSRLRLLRLRLDHGAFNLLPAIVLLNNRGSNS
jgi:hypothetical protein